jgi:acyl carrier protein
MFLRPDSTMESTVQQLKEIVIEGLRIKDRTAAEMPDDQPLMGGDIEIDSIDVLQLILEIERHFGIKLVEGEFDPSAWKTIASLAKVVDEKIAMQG